MYPTHYQILIRLDSDIASAISDVCTLNRQQIKTIAINHLPRFFATFIRPDLFTRKDKCHGHDDQTQNAKSVHI